MELASGFMHIRRTAEILSKDLVLYLCLTPEHQDLLERELRQMSGALVCVSATQDTPLGRLLGLMFAVAIGL